MVKEFESYVFYRMNKKLRALNRFRLKYIKEYIHIINLNKLK